MTAPQKVPETVEEMAAKLRSSAWKETLLWCGYQISDDVIALISGWLATARAEARAAALGPVTDGEWQALARAYNRPGGSAHSATNALLSTRLRQHASATPVGINEELEGSG